MEAVSLVIWSFFSTWFDTTTPTPPFFKLNSGNKIYMLILKGQVVERDKAKSPNLMPAVAATIQMSSPLLSIGLIMSVKAAGSTQRN